MCKASGVCGAWVCKHLRLPHDRLFTLGVHLPGQRHFAGSEVAPDTNPAAAPGPSEQESDARAEARSRQADAARPPNAHPSRHSATSALSQSAPTEAVEERVFAKSRSSKSQANRHDFSKADTVA